MVEVEGHLDHASAEDNPEEVEDAEHVVYDWQSVFIKLATDDQALSVSYYVLKGRKACL